MEPELELTETTFHVRWVDGKCIGIVEAVGEVDLAAVVDFKAALIEAAGADEALIIDLARTTYMDSSGFSTLLQVNQILRPMGLPMYLVGANSNINRMLEITRLNSIFSLGDSTDSVLKQLSAPKEAVSAAV